MTVVTDGSGEYTFAPSFHEYTWAAVRVKPRGGGSGVVGVVMS
jgi:hypothetical protein